MVCIMFAAIAAAVDPVPVSVVVDATSAGVPFAHKWKRSFGSGHASLTLRPDWRSHLVKASTQLGLSGVRYHGIFDDDMAVVPAPGVYNFTLVDDTGDFLLKNGVRPIVELSFMPAFVANCTWHGHCKQDAVGCTGYWCTQCNGHGVGPVVNPKAPSNCSSLEFWYQGVKQLPYNGEFGRWHDLVRATVAHAVKRYGLTEVQKWSFEVWNELWGLRWPEDYMALYNASARAVKSVHPSLRVGGPATAALGHLTDFTDACSAGGIPFDFVSSHHYPTDSCPTGAAWDPDCFARDVRAARRTVAGVPFLLTEYNVGCCLGYAGHDVSTAAAFVFRSVGALNDELDVYSYWTFSDVFEEGGMNRVEYKNVYGAMSVSGVPKPVWRAFELLNTHAGDARLPVATSNQTNYLGSGAGGARAAGPPPPPFAVAVPSNSSDTTQLGWAFEGRALQWTNGSAGGGDGGAAMSGGAAAPLCVDSVGGKAAMEMAPCVYLQPSQTFGNAAADGTYTQGDECLDVFEPDAKGYRRIDLYRCNGGANQQFDLRAGALASRWQGMCVAVRSKTAGPPPPPPPPLLPKAYVSAMATINASAAGALHRGGVGAGGIGTLRVFLAFWADPEAAPGQLVDRRVTVHVTHAAAAAPTHATLYMINDGAVRPAAAWVAMGSPPKPDATQLAALLAASEVRAVPGAPLARLNETCTATEVTLVENSAVVVAFA